MNEDKFVSPSSRDQSIMKNENISFKSYPSKENCSSSIAKQVREQKRVYEQTYS
jgi:hypothetical protein